MALSAKTGEHLWSAPCQQTYNAPPDVLVTGGLVDALLDGNATRLQRLAVRFTGMVLPGDDVDGHLRPPDKLRIKHVRHRRPDIGSRGKRLEVPDDPAVGEFQ